MLSWNAWIWLVSVKALEPVFVDSTCSPQGRLTFCNNNVVYGYIKRSVDKNTLLLIQNTNNWLLLTRREVNKWMLTFKLWCLNCLMAGTVQTDFQACYSVTVSFLTHVFRHLWLWSFLSLCRPRTEPRAHRAAEQQRWSWFCLFRTVDTSFGITLQPFE